MGGLVRSFFLGDIVGFWRVAVFDYSEGWE